MPLLNIFSKFYQKCLIFPMLFILYRCSFPETIGSHLTHNGRFLQVEVFTERYLANGHLQLTSRNQFNITLAHLPSNT